MALSPETMQWMAESRARMGQVRPERTVLGRARDVGMGTLAAVGTVLDYPRRGIAYAGYRLGGFEHGEAARASESGENLVKLLMPQFAKRSPTQAWLLGVAQETLADPLNLLLPFGLTEKGLKAAKAGTMGLTWAGQAAAGQRATLQLVWPSLKGGFHINRHVFLRGPRAVTAMAGAGHWLSARRPFSWFRTTSLNPHVRAAKRIMEETVLDPANPRGSIMMLKMNLDEAAGALAEKIPKESLQDFWRASEHVGRPGPTHRQALRAIAPDIQEFAKAHQALIQAGEDLIEMGGLKRPRYGGQMTQALQDVSRATSQELRLMRDPYTKLGSLLSKQDRKVYMEAIDAIDNSARATAKASLSPEAIRRVAAEAAPPPKVGERIVRVVAPGEAVSVQKPHGLYVTLGEVSPHAGDIPGGKPLVGRMAPKAPLNVGTETITHARFGAAGRGQGSAGVVALKRLVGEGEFARLSRLRKTELVAELTRRFPGPDYSRYYDSYELLEAYGGQLAREKGFDAIVQRDLLYPAFSEAVILKEGAMSSRLATPGIPLAKKPGGLVAQADKALQEATAAEIASIKQVRKVMGIADDADGVARTWERGQKQLTSLYAREAALSEIAEKQPNWLMRYLTPEARGKVLQFPGVRKSLTSVTWTDDLHGAVHRQFRERLDAATLAPLGTWEKARKVITRDMTMDEILTLLKEAPEGTRIPTYAKVAEGGVVERIKAWAAKAPQQPQLKNFYQMDVAKTYTKWTDHIMSAIEGKGFMDAIASNPELLSRVPGRPGWLHVKELSTKLANYTGDAWLHPEAFGELQRMYTRILNPESMNRFVRAYDKITRAFKYAVTQPWPAYHWRNAITDTLNMTTEGAFSIKTVFVNGDQIARGKGMHYAGKALGMMPGDELRRLGKAHRVTWGQSTSIARQSIGAYLENQRRFGFFLDGLQRGYTPYDSALRVKRALFDYGDLTAFERTVMKRVMPFYGWTKNISRLTAQTLFQRPNIISAQLRLGGSVEKLEDAPAWVRGRQIIALQPDQQTGEERMLIGLGLPIEDVSEMLDFNGGYKEWIRQIAFRFNPMLKLGIGITGLDIERMRRLDRPVSAPYLSFAYDRLSKDKVGYLERVFGARKRRGRKGKSYYTVHPYFDFIMRQLPTTRAYSLAKTAGRPEVGLGTLGLAVGTGYRVLPYDPKRTREYEERSRRMERLRSLARTGDVGLYPVPYRPRGSRLSAREFQELRR